MEPEISRESWSICIEPNEATDPSFRSLKVLFTLQEILLCAEKQNISGEIQLKKALNFDELRDLLGPNIYLNGGPQKDHREMVHDRQIQQKGLYFHLFHRRSPEKL